MRKAKAARPNLTASHLPVARPSFLARYDRNSCERQLGNQAMLRRLSSTTPRLQRKLTIGAVNDPLEAQADHIADQVMRMPVPGVSVSSGPFQASRKCAACEEEDKNLQAKPDGTLAQGEAPPAPVTSAPRQLRRECDACVEEKMNGGCAACYDDLATVQVRPKAARQPGACGGAAPSIVDDALRYPGQPLDSVTRTFFEPRFGYDFSRVRVHTDTIAAQSAAAIGAHAYTVGSDIMFSNARFDPNSRAGRELIAHELTHVVQQSGQPKIVSRDDAAASTPAPQSKTPSDGVRALADRFEMYATKGEAALPCALISASDGNRIRANIAKLRTAIAGMRKVADNADDHISVTLLASFTSSRLQKSSTSLHAAARQSPAVTVSETEPAAVAAFRPDIGFDNAVEREAQQIGRIIGSVAPSSVPSSSILVMRQAAPEIVQQVAQEAPVIDQLIDVSTIGLGLGVAANDTVALGALAALLGSPVVVVAAVVVVALLAAAAVWYFWDESLSEETRKVKDIPPQTGYPAPAPGVTPPSPPPPVAVHPDKDSWKTTFNETDAELDAEASADEAEDVYSPVEESPKPPGECTKERHRKLQDDVNSKCKRLPRGCTPDMNCRQLRRNWYRNERCARARDLINNECFKGGDPGHTGAAAAAWRAAQNCREMYRRKC